VVKIALQVAQRADGGHRRRWLPAGAEPPMVPRLAVVPRRWVVERSFAWLGRCRRLSKDYEFLPATAAAVIHLAMIQLLVRRRTRPDLTFSDTLQVGSGLKGVNVEQRLLDLVRVVDVIPVPV
jgi:hypothetical protein